MVSMDKLSQPCSLYVRVINDQRGKLITCRNECSYSRWKFHGRTIKCSQYVPRGPSYDTISVANRVCATTGARAGEGYVDGDTYLSVNFNYTSKHLWRNFGVIMALMVLGCAIYLLATEYISEQRSRGTFLIFPRAKKPYSQPRSDLESNSFRTGKVPNVATTMALQTPAHLQAQTSIFQWDSVCYDIKVNKKQEKRLLNNVEGWVRPGTLTALMVYNLSSSLKLKVRLTRLAGRDRGWENDFARCTSRPCNYRNCHWGDAC